MVEPDDIVGRQDMQDRPPPIRQLAGTERKAAADQDHRGFGIAGPDKRRVTAGKADRRLQKGLTQTAAAEQQILGNRGSVARPFRQLDARQRKFFCHVPRLAV